jgi:hypothetical protein
VLVVAFFFSPHLRDALETSVPSQNASVEATQSIAGDGSGTVERIVAMDTVNIDGTVPIGGTDEHSWLNRLKHLAIMQEGNKKDLDAVIDAATRWQSSIQPRPNSRSPFAIPKTSHS